MIGADPSIEGHLRGVLKVLAIGAGFATVPILADLAALQPPWPPAIGPVSAAMLLLSSVVVWAWTRSATDAGRRPWIVASAVLTTVGLVLYLVLYSQFVEPVTGTHVRVVRGYACTAEALQVYGDACPDLGRDALRGAEWETSVLWTRGSITVVQTALAVAWIVFLAGLVCATGVVVPIRSTGSADDRGEADGG